MKTMYIKLVIVLFAAISLLSSCASVDTQSYVDPDFRNHKFTKICVMVNEQDLRNREYIEKEFVKEFADQGINADMSVKMMPPTREWTDEMIHTFLEKNGFDGLLIIDPTGQDVEEIYNPGELITETKGVEKKKSGGKKVYKETTTTTSTASTSKKYHASFSASLFDIKTNKKAWVATSTSESDEGWSQNFDMIFDAYASDIVEKLGQDGMIAVKK
jgi:hypothetical protein